MAQHVRFDEVKSRVSMKEVLAHYDLMDGTTEKAGKHGMELRLHCPFHEDKTPSLSINAETGKFHIPPNYVVERVRRSSKAARGEDLQVEHPVWCGDAPAFHFHAPLAGMLSPTLIGDQIIEVRQPC
jgi:hypothetical protein